MTNQPMHYTLVRYIQPVIDPQTELEAVALVRADRPDTFICNMHVPVEDVDAWNRLLRATAERAWDQGREAGQESVKVPNPYLALLQAEEADKEEPEPYDGIMWGDS